MKVCLTLLCDVGAGIVVGIPGMLHPRFESQDFLLDFGLTSDIGCLSWLSSAPKLDLGHNYLPIIGVKHVWISK